MDATIRMFLVGGVGMFAILFLGNSFRWWSEVSASRLPGREKLLRSPGESMRRNMEQLNEYLIYSVAVFLLVPLAFAWKTPNLSNLWPCTFLICLMVISALPGILVVRLHRNYALGLCAERAVGEELNQLMLDGCHVFHDYPAGPDWYINHIVVAPSGVYAVETKCGRKGRSSDPCREPDVVFDGGTLRFPSYNSGVPIEQARRSAKILSQQLSATSAQAFEVKPILSLPGWRVICRGRSDVQVLSPKEIWKNIITTATPKLSEEEIQRIAFRIQQKCRDVEI
jgi:hypothetical protein